MNTLMRFLHDRRDVLPAQCPSSERLSCLFVTPSFRTSGHVLIWVIDKRDRRPVLIAKVPRIAGDDRQLEIEARNLQRAQALRNGELESIPKIVAFDVYCGHKFLVETIVRGTVIRESSIRRDPSLYIGKSLDWLTRFHAESRCENSRPSDWYSQLVETPLDLLESVLPKDFAARAWVDGTLANNGILLRPTGVPNLAFGDPDTSWFSQVALDGAGPYEASFATSEPFVPAPFVPPPPPPACPAAW